MISLRQGLTLTSLCVLSLIALIKAGAADAGTYYVSSSGTATWGQATDINTPTNVQTAFNNAVAGDIVYFRGGTYNVPAKNFGDTYHGYYEPAHSGSAGNPITFQAYPGETTVFNGTAGGTGDTPDYATIFGTNGASYIVFDGFFFQSDNGTKMARIIIWGSGTRPNHDTLINCTIYGGTSLTSSTDNREGLRVENSDYITVQNTRIYSYRNTAWNHNTSAVKLYHDTNFIFANNEIYNCTEGLYYKSAVDTAHTVYNYIHDNYECVFTDSWAAGYDMPNHSYHDNVIANCSYTAMNIYGEGGNLNNLSVYNNTIYMPTTSGDNRAIFIGNSYSYISSNSIAVYNNIILGSAEKLTFPGTGTITECEYNQYGNLGSFNVRTNYGSGSVTYTSLSNWHTSTAVSGSVHPEGATTLNGLASDPLFVNGSGNYSQLSDFNLQAGSPCKGSGKGGMNMGANVALVGTGMPPSKVPNPPTNVR